MTQMSEQLVFLRLVVFVLNGIIFSRTKKIKKIMYQFIYISALKSYDRKSKPVQVDEVIHKTSYICHTYIV